MMTPLYENPVTSGVAADSQWGYFVVDESVYQPSQDMLPSTEHYLHHDNNDSRWFNGVDQVTIDDLLHGDGTQWLPDSMVPRAIGDIRAHEPSREYLIRESLPCEPHTAARSFYGYESELPTIPEVFIPPPTAERAFSYEEPVHQSVNYPAFDNDQVPQTENCPAVLIQHPILLPNQQSTYSELSANLAYMSSLSMTPPNGNPHENINDERRKERVTSKMKGRRYKGMVEVADPVAAALLSKMGWSGEKPLRQQVAAAGSKSNTVEDSAATSRSRKGVTLTPRQGSAKAHPPKRIPPPYGIGKVGGTSSRGSSTGKKLGLACLFCRERKIACGRPSESNPDQTCNQCARRLFKCEYPTESRRGQHKRPKNKPDVT